MPTRRPTNTTTNGARPARSRDSQRARSTEARRAAEARNSSAPQHRRASRPASPNYLPYIIVGAIIVVLLTVGLSTCARSCSAGNDSSSNNSNDVAANDNPANEETDKSTDAENAGDKVNAPSVEEIVAALPDVIENEDKVALAERAQTDADALWIAEHAADYAFIDSYIQWKLLRLAAYEPQATEFVRNVIDRYPAATASPWNGTLTAGEVPHLYQWDPAWGYTDYCGLPFGTSGCCPTSFSMVAMYFSGSTECTPYVAGVDAAEHGYAVDYVGSDGSFITNRAEAYGFSAYSAYLDGDGLKAALQAGNLVICNVGPGDFTVGGHFIVATGLSSDGNVIVNDPYSTRNSAVTWDADRIANQTMVFYVCSK